MKSIANAGHLNHKGSSVTKRQALYKKLIVSQLKRIHVGGIVLIENDEKLHFGDASKLGDDVVTIRITDPRTYKMVLTGGTIGAGEAYMLGYWQVDNLVGLIQLMLKNRAGMQNMESRFSWVKKSWSSILNKSRINSLRGSKRNIVAHYDLSNDFFSLFLDPTMMYSSAIYENDEQGLNEASIFKLNHICQRLKLTEDDHLLEIGTGWGGMAIHAAQNFGCRVTTTTISDEQYDYAKARIEKLGLSDRITLLKKDYRLLEGQYDKLVSIEMIEAVGHQFYDEFFKGCSSLLKPDGLALIQAITATDQRFEIEKNKTDFIRRYIFPGGCLPSNNIIFSTLARCTDMHCVGLEDITRFYARTLQEWRERFLAALPEVKAMGFDDVFIRMWEFYLAYCEGGFRERQINTTQFVFAKPEARCLPSIS